MTCSYINLRLLSIALLTLIICPLFAGEAYFAGDPAISPEGSEVCFVYDDDLWIVPFKGGVPRRITRTDSKEWNPQWSPDGKLIAFSSNREGQNYVYTMPSEGGPATVVIRENLGISEWFSDSQNLLCTKYTLQWGSAFYKVPINGSRPILIAEVANRYATLSPDNTQIVFQQGGYSKREAYRGSANGELWLLDIASKKYTKLTNTELSELYPRFSQANNTLFFCASDGNSFQVNKVSNLNFTKATQISQLKTFSARDISVARANDRLVFEVFDGIYKYDSSKLFGDKISKLEINLAEDEWQSDIIRDNMKNTFHNYTVSPDELLVGFNYKYDSFFMPRKGGEVKQISFDHSGINSMQFLDNRTLVLSKREKGKNRLYTAHADTVISLKPVDWFGADSLGIEDFSKDDNGRWVFSYVDYFRHNKIAIADSGMVNIRPIETPWAVTTNFAINKNGTHAVYGSVRDDNYIRELYLYDMKTGENKKLLADDAWLSSLYWTPDNKSILLSRNRSIYRLDLVPRDENEFEKDNWKEIFSPTKPVSDSTKTTAVGDSTFSLDIVIEDEQKSSAPQALNVVWEGLNKRLYEVIPSTVEWLFVFDVLSDSTFYYIEDATLLDKNTTLKKANIYGKNIKEEANFGKEAGNFSLVGKTIYYLDGSQLKSYAIPMSAKKSVVGEFDYQYDKSMLNKRVFEEAWGAFGDNFYDPDMHGKNWAQLYELYRPYVDKAKTIEEVGEIISEMIGDVNASHTGFYPRIDQQQFSNPSAWLGLELDYSSVLPEGIMVSRVYPTSRLASIFNLKEGNIITHIDGVQITPTTPVDSLLAGKIDKKIRLKYLSEGTSFDADLIGLSYSKARDLWYSYSYEQSRLLVDKLSSGRLGYIHIPAMGNSDWNTFYTELFRDNFDKEALVIDVRGNVGGHIHDQLITLLQKRRYAYSTSRSSNHIKRGEPRRAWDKPSIVLVNNDSFSDGEIFPVVYQELKLGKVVGTPSSGAVIGTWQYYLLDGSSMRMPGSGWYMVDGTNMEGTGARPDIIVENLPEDIINERDPQLERAVIELLKELK